MRFGSRPYMRCPHRTRLAHSSRAPASSASDTPPALAVPAFPCSPRRRRQPWVAPRTSSSRASRSVLSRPLSSPVASPSRRALLVAEIGWIGPPFSPSVPPAAERRGAAVYIDLARKLVWSHIVAREGFVIAEFGFAVSAKGDRVLDRSAESPTSMYHM